MIDQREIRGETILTGGMSRYTYPMRIIGASTSAVVAFIHLRQFGDFSLASIAFLAFALSYPHFVYMLANRLPARQVELTTIPLDCVILGLTAYLTGFSLVPTITGLTVAFANGLALGGLRLMLIAAAGIGLGMFGPMPWSGTNLAPKNVWEINAVCSGFLFVYLNVFAYTAFVRTLALQSSRKELKQQKVTAEIERKKAVSLLLSLLPESIATELDRSGAVRPRFFESATLLLVDFPNFNEITAALSPEELLREVNTCFRAFDAIARRHRLEGLKSVGSAYYAVGGLPQPNESHGSDAVRAALEIRRYCDDAKRARGGGPWFDLRIAIHSGPLTAGIVETRRFSYDVWGDTLETARGVSQAIGSGELAVSNVTRDLAGNQFVYEPAGALPTRDGSPLSLYRVLEAQR